MNWVLQNQFFVLGGLLVLGLAVSFFSLQKLSKKIKVIFGGRNVSEENFQPSLVRRLTEVEMKLEELEPRMKIVEAIGEMSVQKIGFVRFNPFHNTGGDNSFIVALLDRRNNGILISSLYTREGVRVYAKNIEKGISKNALSEEEAKLLADTLKKEANN